MAAKKSSSPSPSLISMLIKLVVVAGICLGGYLLYENQKDYLHNLVLQPQKAESIICFESDFTPEMLQKQLEKKLLKNERYSFADSQYLYLPHLLVDVKYSPDGRSTQTSKMLWDMQNGELILDTRTFETTSGFQDCLTSKANTEDFRILNLLAQSGGSISKERLINQLGYDEDLASARIDALRKKQLVTSLNDTVRIHVENSFFSVAPKTNITLPLVTKKSVRGQLVSNCYSSKELLAMISSAFGSDLAVRQSQIVYIPIIQLDIANPDGSIRTTYWNAITGKNCMLN